MIMHKTSKAWQTKVGDVVTSPGLWTTSGPLAGGCSQQHLPRKCFLGHSILVTWPNQRIAEISLLGEVNRHSGFYEFNSCALGDAVNSTKIPFLPLVLGIIFFQSWQLCGVWKLPFCGYRPIKPTQKFVFFNIPCINLLVLPSFTCEYRPRYLNLSRYCSVCPRTCRVHYLRFLKTDEIWYLGWEVDRSSACRMPGWEVASSTESSAKSK